METKQREEGRWGVKGRMVMDGSWGFTGRDGRGDEYEKKIGCRVKRVRGRANKR